jgi:hypothetical protein
MQDHVDPRAFTIVERYENETVAVPSISFYMHQTMLTQPNLVVVHRVKNTTSRTQSVLKFFVYFATVFLVWSTMHRPLLPSSPMFWGAKIDVHVSHSQLCFLKASFEGFVSYLNSSAERFAVLENV